MFEQRLEPFLTALTHKAQRRWTPVYLQGLLGPGQRKSVEPMASRVAPGDVQQLHQFVSTSVWDMRPLEAIVLWRVGLTTPSAGGEQVYPRRYCFAQRGRSRSRNWTGRVQGAEFGCVVADAGYGNGAEFRRGLSARELLWAVGILPTLKVYPADVELMEPPYRARGRPRKHLRPSEENRPAQEAIACLGEEASKRITWRWGRKGELGKRQIHYNPRE